MSFAKLFEKLSDLPVAGIMESVARSVSEGLITILVSATGSGKTLLQPARLAEHLSSESDDPVVVLVPRRFLAVNAAETVAELAELELGVEVGYAVGNQAGDKSMFSKKTQVLYATYGYALASGLIWTVRKIVLDEVHETTMDMSIVRAILHRRRTRGENLTILEMSATIDAERQAQYWNIIARTKVFQIDGKTYPCELRHRPAGDVPHETLELLREGRKGILVFRPGVGEVEETATKVSELAVKAGLDIEVSQLYGDMSWAERAEATKAPKANKAKVLVATNVAETGVNIPWLDAGASCGTGKENSVRPETGATYLELVDIAQWRLQQQEGRVKRFRPGIFVLCSPLGFTDRPVQTVPEITRLALSELVMHCAGFDLRAHELHFDYAPEPGKVEAAEVMLQRLGLIDEDCRLTEAGRFVIGLPVGPEAGAMLWYAKQTGCLEVALGLVAVIEAGGLRKDPRSPHGFDYTSDYLDGLKAFIYVYPTKGKERRDTLERYNIGFKRFQAASDLMWDLSRRLEVEPSDQVEGREECLRRCIVAGMLERIFRSAGYFGGSVLSVSKPGKYNIGNGSVVSGFESDELCVGHLRIITPKDRLKLPFTIVEKVTKFTVEDLEAVGLVRSGVLTRKTIKSESLYSGGTTYEYEQMILFGQYVLKERLVREIKPDIETPPQVMFTSTLRAPSPLPKVPVTPPAPPEPETASRDVLQDLLKVGIGGKSS